MRKILKVAVLTVSLVSLLVLSSYSVYAAGYDSLTWQGIQNIQLYRSDQGATGWTDLTSIGYDYNADTGKLTVRNSGYVYNGIRFDLRAQGYVKTTAGSYFVISVINYDYFTGSMASVGGYYAKCTVYTSAGVYEMSGDLAFTTLGTNRLTWTYQGAGNFGTDGLPMDLYRVNFETNIPSHSAGAGPYEITLSVGLTTELTLEQQNHLETMQKIDDAADQISDSIEEQTDAIINEDYGYEQDENKGNVDNGVSSLSDNINALSNQINQSFTDFQGAVSGIADAIDSSSTVIWGWLDYVPSWFVAVIVALGGILAARKVLK